MLSENYNQEFDPWAYKTTQTAQLIEIAQSDFEAMKDSIDESIDREKIGLDDVMLKKILLAYNTGKYSRNADIIIELGSLVGDHVDVDGDGKLSYNEKNYSDYNEDGQITEEEIEMFKINKELLQKCLNDESLCSPFKLVRGGDIEQLKEANLDASANVISSVVKDIGTFFKTLFTGGNAFDDIYETELYLKELREIKVRANKYYLHAKGVIKFVTDVKDKETGVIAEKELVYFNEDVLEKIYIEEFQANRYGASSDYAESVWECLSTSCYTDSPNGGIRMYSHATVEEELTEWTFEPEGAKVQSFKDFWDYAANFDDEILKNIAINRQKISEEYLYRSTEWEADAGRLFDLDTNWLRKPSCYNAWNGWCIGYC